MFDRDVRHAQFAPRTLQTSKFGAYSKLSVPKKRTPVKDVLWMLLYGMAVGAVWYVVTALRAGA